MDHLGRGKLLRSWRQSSKLTNWIRTPGLIRGAFNFNMLNSFNLFYFIFLTHFFRILVVGPSNSAADVIAMNLVASNQFETGDFVRLVGFMRQEFQVPESIRDYCVDGDCIDTVARHRLIVCTSTTAGQFFQLGLHTGHFTHVFIDEAGYCTEPEALIASCLVALDKSGQVGKMNYFC